MSERKPYRKPVCTWGAYSVQDNCVCEECQWRRELIRSIPPLPSPDDKEI